LLYDHLTCKAALKFVTAQAKLFKEYLTEDSEKMYGRLVFLCKHQNPKLRNTAFPALDEFLSQVSAELVKGARNQLSDETTFRVSERLF
jgi:hypothetical protein